ncbi:MAG: hypothetical protein CL920_13270 [Deltaproteobacteria bacterium]|nr:hypothetical protein [Deltaproteobacteria bacterium]MBU49660.1 hypothetical protein [Deltaproteobacteria bacterium]
MRRPSSRRRATFGSAQRQRFTSTERRALQACIDTAKHIPTLPHRLEAILQLERAYAKEHLSKEEFWSHRHDLSLTPNELLHLLEQDTPELSDFPYFRVIPASVWTHFLHDCLWDYPEQTDLLQQPPPPAYQAYMETYEQWSRGEQPRAYRLRALDTLIKALVDRPARIGTIHDYIHYSLLSVLRGLRTHLRRSDIKPSFWVELTMPLPTIISMEPTPEGGWQVGEQGVLWMRRQLAKRFREALNQQTKLLTLIQSRKTYLETRQEWQQHLEDVLY